MPGQIASDPGGSLEALADIAQADGANRELWLLKAAISAGSTQVGVQVNGEPRFRVIEDAVERGSAVFAICLDAALQEIVAAIADHAGE